MKKSAFLFVLWGLLPALARAQTLESPDGRFRFHYCTVEGAMGYCVTFCGDTIVRPSRLGVDVENQLFESALAVPRGNNTDWSSDLELRSCRQTEQDTTWCPPYGENSRVRDHYRQLTLHFEKGTNGQGTIIQGYDKRKFYAMDVVVRAYDEGVALRYHFPETSNGLFLHVTGERTAFRMPEGCIAWYEEWAQGPYEMRPLRQPWMESERPLLIRLQSGSYVALLEAGLIDFPRGKFILKGDDELQVKLYGDVDLISPYDTPWRVVMAAERAIDLINHKELILNLCEPAPADVAAWTAKLPGRAFRSARLDKASILRSIDFCADFGIEYVELDAGWYGPEGKVESDARQAAPTRDFRMEDVCDYARKKGVGVWIYVNQRALARQLDELLPIYRQWGVSGLKFGFVQVGSAQWTQWLHEAVGKCAAYGLAVDIHDEYRPTGLSRTMPNLLTQEGVRGNEEMPDAKHNTTLPFTRFLSGPADYTLCYFNNRVRCTRAHQLAMAAVFYSPLQFLFWYDRPYPEGWDGPELQFWRDCPTVFDESRALDGQPGEFIVQARRKGNDWFVGALNGNTPRTIILPTDFLEPDRNYTLTLFTDAPPSPTAAPSPSSSKLPSPSSNEASSSSNEASSPSSSEASSPLPLPGRVPRVFARASSSPAPLPSSPPSKVTSRTITLKAGAPLTLPLLPSGGAALHFTPTNNLSTR